MDPTLRHALPYVLFAVLTHAAGWLPEEVRMWVDPARTLLVGGALIVLAARGVYPELATRETARKAALPLALVCGAVVGAAWVPLAEIASFGERESFAPGGEGGLATALLGLRLVGFVLVVPVMEELFVRSLVPRLIDGLRSDRDWQDVPACVFTPMSFACSVALFTATHPEWLAALVTGLIWTVLIAFTRRLRDAIVAHAIANAWLAVYILQTGESQWW